jgi:hypothetical protein
MAVSKSAFRYPTMPPTNGMRLQHGSEHGAMGAQLQGDGAGAQMLYFYKNRFLRTQRGHPSAIYPGADGRGFRFNGNCRQVTLDSNEISYNPAEASSWVAVAWMGSASLTTASSATAWQRFQAILLPTSTGRTTMS